MPVYEREYRRKGRVIWGYQFNIQKTRYRKSGFPSCDAAKTAEAEAREAVRRVINSKTNKPVVRERTSFGLFLPIFIAHRTTMQKSPRTVENERRRGNFLSKTFGHRLLQDIGVADIQDYVEFRIEQERRNRSINLELTFLRSFYKLATQRGYASHNPAKDVGNLPEEENEEVWIPSDEELKRFIKAAGETSAGAYLVPWILFRAYTGTRKSESFFLEWQDIDMQRNCIWIRPKPGNPLKNRKRRQIPLHPVLKPILLEWRTKWDELTERHYERFGGERHDWVFITGHGHGKQAASFVKTFYQAREAARLPEMTTHTLRHYFISKCLMSKEPIPLFTIARWVGHSNTRMIEKVYAHLLPDYSAREMGKLDLGLDSVSTPTNTGSEQGSPENEKCDGSAEKAPKKSPEANIIAFAANS